MSKFKCNLIVPGFAKSGTSSLHEYLDIHPNICMSRPKETHFFAIDEKYERGYEFHNKNFEKCCKQKNIAYYGESSTTYSIWELALDRIAADLNNPKIILLLRHPLERTISHYNWLWSLYLENRPLFKAIFAEQKAGFHPNIHLRGNYPCYLLASNYSFWCPLIVEKFGEKNVLFLDSKELFQEKEKAMGKCFVFLGIQSVAIEKNIHNNKTGETVLQRTLGLERIKKYIPSSIVEKYDPDKKIISAILKIMGEKKVRYKTKFSNNDIVKLKEIIKEDICFYEKKFSKNKLISVLT